MKKKEVKLKVEMENEKQLRERLTKLGITLRIKDDPVNQLFYYDGVVNGKRCETMSRYKKIPKEEALAKLTKKQQQLIEELTINFN